MTRDEYAKAIDCDRRYFTGGCLYDAGKPCECKAAVKAQSTVAEQLEALR